MQHAADAGPMTLDPEDALAAIEMLQKESAGTACSAVDDVRNELLRAIIGQEEEAAEEEAAEEEEEEEEEDTAAELMEHDGFAEADPSLAKASKSSAPAPPAEEDFMAALSILKKVEQGAGMAGGSSMLSQTANTPATQSNKKPDLSRTTPGRVASLKNKNREKVPGKEKIRKPQEKASNKNGKPKHRPVPSKRHQDRIEKRLHGLSDSLHNSDVMDTSLTMEQKVGPNFKMPMNLPSMYDEEYSLQAEMVGGFRKKPTKQNNPALNLHMQEQHDKENSENAKNEENPAYSPTGSASSSSFAPSSPSPKPTTIRRQFSNQTSKSVNLPEKHDKRCKQFTIKPGQSTRPIGVAPANVLAKNCPSNLSKENRRMMEKQKMDRLDIKSNVLGREQVKERATVLARNTDNNGGRRKCEARDEENCADTRAATARAAGESSPGRAGQAEADVARSLSARPSPGRKADKSYLAMRHADNLSAPAKSHSVRRRLEKEIKTLKAQYNRLCVEAMVGAPPTRPKAGQPRAGGRRGRGAGRRGPRARGAVPRNQQKAKAAAAAATAAAAVDSDAGPSTQQQVLNSLAATLKAKEEQLIRVIVGV